MITDANSHLASIYDKDAYQYFAETGKIMDRVTERYFDVMKWVDKSILVAFPSGPHMNDNAPIAAFAAQHRDRVAPFLLIDPTKPDPLDQIAKVVDQGAAGVHMAPIYQKFRPDDEAIFDIYRKLEELQLPLIWFQGSSFEAVDGPMEWANPVLLDKVARTFPELRMLIAHFGSPWTREVVALIKKHKHVYTEISALSARSWVLYGAIIEAIQYGAADKILFGSEFPMYTPDQNRDALQAICSFGEGANLARIPTSFVDELMTRDAYSLLGVRPG